MNTEELKKKAMTAIKARNGATYSDFVNASYAFFEAANPATILSLIADFERITNQHGELQSALERMVDLANNDGLWCNYDEVIHAEAVLERIYKSRQKVEG